MKLISPTVEHHFRLSIIISTFALTQSIVSPHLPGHNDTFQSIRTQNKVYVDKTNYLPKLLESEHRFYRMCRPGRFGKSNFLQMLNAFFKGEKQLFEGLAIYEKHDWRKSYPVIYVDFSSMDVRSLYAVNADLNQAIIQTGRSYGIEIDEKLPLYPGVLKDFHQQHCGNDSKLGQLIHHLSDEGRTEQSVVVLIDEYDWPRQMHSPRYASAKKHDRTIFEAVLNPFFHQFERMKRYVRFLFATCTSIASYRTRSRNKYPNLPITLHDLTFDPQFSQMIGLTGAELKSDLKPHIDAMIGHRSNDSFDSVVQRLRKRYNGYCFSRENVSVDSECRLYNFHSVVTCMRDKRLDYQWHPAADPKYNIVDDYPVSNAAWTAERAMRYVSRVHPDTFLISRDELEESDRVSDQIPMSVCMVLYGYLTLRGYDERNENFVLAVPNEEMRLSFQRAVLKFLLGRDTSLEEFFEMCSSLRASMLAGGAKTFFDSLNALAFQLVNNETHMYSQKYPQMMYSPERIIDVFKTCDFSLRENTTSENDDGFKVELCNEYRVGDRVDGYEYFGLKMELAGRTELWVRFESRRSASCATNVLLKAIANRFEQELQNRTIHLLGVNIDTLDRPIEDWIWITYDSGKFNNVQASHSRYVAMYNAHGACVHPKQKT